MSNLRRWKVTLPELHLEDNSEFNDILYDVYSIISDI